LQIDRFTIGGPKMGVVNNSRFIFSNISKSINWADSLQKQATKVERDFVKGKASIHELTVATQKASLAVETVTRLKEAILEAYREVMRMQI